MENINTRKDKDSRHREALERAAERKVEREEEQEVNDAFWANSTVWWVVGLIAIFIIFFLIWI